MINLGKISAKGKEIILVEKENGCIECISHCKDNDGYTRICINGKPDRLFRYVYEQKYGKIPKGMLIRHKCDNTSCCNINHLEIGTPYDNVHDMIDRHRDVYKIGKCFGTKNGASKLNEEQVKEIYLSNLSNSILSKIYNVSRRNISCIRNKKTWKWLTDTLDEKE